MSVEIEGHTSRAFDGALSALHVRVVTLGGLVLSQAREAAHAYTEWDRGTAQSVVEREPAVNADAAAIEAEALQIIARRQPVALDLRAIHQRLPGGANLGRQAKFRPDLGEQKVRPHHPVCKGALPTVVHPCGNRSPAAGDTG